MKGRYQGVPRAGPKRERLREKGQFWTPDWLAEAMVAYVIADGCDHIFDPAVGEGAFFRSAKGISARTGKLLRLVGTEIDPAVLHQALCSGLSEDDLSSVKITDFVLQPPRYSYSAIVANPPYIRHHRLPPHVKAELRKLSTQLVGKALDGRAGLHIYFLIRALQLLAPYGRLAFIMPADTCEGVFAGALWEWITKNYCLEAVITFSPEASPFPGVDTNPVIFLIRNTPPEGEFLWARCTKSDSPDLRDWIQQGLGEFSSDALSVQRRTLVEGLTTGLSRSPAGLAATPAGPRLGDLAKVLRGIATGANDYFFLTARRAASLEIPGEFLRPAVGRTRDIAGSEITPETIERLEALGRPTLLLCVDASPMERLPAPIQRYLRYGEQIGIHKKALVATRRPWYKMEVRPVPPILFAYLGRRNVRFLHNIAGVLPLTGFLCVYPHSDDSEFVQKLWTVLQHPATIANLAMVGKSYGAGAVKVEPRALEKLPLPVSVIEQVGLRQCLDCGQRKLVF